VFSEDKSLLKGLEACALGHHRRGRIVITDPRSCHTLGLVQNDCRRIEEGRAQARTSAIGHYADHAYVHKPREARSKEEPEITQD
jgi:hypothetical protein